MVCLFYSFNLKIVMFQELDNIFTLQSSFNFRNWFPHLFEDPLQSLGKILESLVTHPAILPKHLKLQSLVQPDVHVGRVKVSAKISGYNFNIHPAWKITFFAVLHFCENFS